MRIVIEDAQGGLEEIRAAVVQELIQRFSADLELLSPSQVCGLLDVTPPALADMKLDKVDLLGNGRTIRYRASDVRKKLAERTIRAMPEPTKKRRKPRAAA